MPQANMKQPAFAQPTHRRPSWAKNEAMYKTNIARSTPRSYGPCSDLGLDNFSYDKAHTAEFAVPDGVLEMLPPELRKAATTWVVAAAALNTNLDRIHKLDEDPIAQVEPPGTRSGSTSFSTWTSFSSSPPIAPVDSGIGTPFTSPPQSFDSSIIAPIAKYSYHHLPPHILGMDTPPFTPVDTRGPNTPANSIRVFNGNMPDPLSLDVQLAPLSSPDTLSLFSPIDSNDSSEFEAEKAWESYAKTYNAEVYDLKHASFPRFVGLDRNINKLLVELEIESSMSPELQIAVNRFRRWWRGHRGRVARYQVKVDAVHEKSLPEC